MKLRAGIPHGAYAERPQTGDGWVDRCAAGVNRWIEAGWDLRLRYRWVLAGLVHHQARLAELSSALLREEGQALRHRLVREGPSREVLVLALPWLREATWRSTGVRLRDAQLLSSAALFEGALVELGGGEGKSATIAVVAALTALCGRPCHVISPREEQARASHDRARGLFDFLELRHGLVLGAQAPRVRRASYSADIVYVSGPRLMLDYLQDRVQLRGQGGRARLALQRFLGAADARGGLLLDGLYVALVDDADQLLIEDAWSPLSISDPEQASEELRVARMALSLAGELVPGREVSIAKLEQSLELTEAGEERVQLRAREWGGAWLRPAWREARLRQALLALHLWRRGTTHDVRDGALVVTDLGRIMLDLHGAEVATLVRVHEGLPGRGDHNALTQVCVQSFFQRYLRVSGIATTLVGARRELARLYRVPLYRALSSSDIDLQRAPERLYRTTVELRRALLATLHERVGRGRAVLIGVRNLTAARELLQLLRDEGLDAHLCDGGESGVVRPELALAARRGRVTLLPARALHGLGAIEGRDLVVVMAELLEARRHEELLVQHAARGGGRVEVLRFAALDEPLFASSARPQLLEALAGPFTAGGRLRPLGLAGRFMRGAQLLHERRARHQREDLLRHERRRDALLAFGGPRDL